MEFIFTLLLIIFSCIVIVKFCTKVIDFLFDDLLLHVINNRRKSDRT